MQRGTELEEQLFEQEQRIGAAQERKADEEQAQIDAQAEQTYLARRAALISTLYDRTSCTLAAAEAVPMNKDEASSPARCPLVASRRAREDALRSYVQIEREREPWDPDAPSAKKASINLVDLDLQQARLPKGRLEGANLYEANLQGAKLWKADLYKAHLYKANLRRAHLEGAHLYKAHLYKANLRRAHLEGAHLDGAKWNCATVWPEGFELPGQPTDPPCAVSP